MKFCKKCFIDEAIQELIKQNGENGTCSNCKREDIEVISIDMGTLKDYFLALLDIYTPIENIKGYSSSNGELLKNILKENWNIFNEEIKSSSIEELLRTILPEKEELYSKKVAISMNNNHDDEISILKNATWEDFVDEIKNRNRFHTEIFKLENLKYFLSQMSLDLKKDKKLYRGRISLEKGYSKKEMGAPPLGKSSSGRLNPEGISCLYLAEDKDTVFLEMRVLKNDFITIGEFKLLKDITIVDLTRVDKISPFYNLDDILKHGVNRNHLKEIAIEISRPQSRANSSLDYLPSQYISEFIKKLGFSGIKYRSTVKNDGINYVIFDEKNFICEETKIYKIRDINCQSHEIGNNE